MVHSQVLDIIDLGIVIIDRHYTVQEWNRWMELHSGISREEIINGQLFNFFPKLSNQSFIRGCKSVLTFGQIVFLSQKLHGWLFPFNLTGLQSVDFEFMQQSCTMAPLTSGESSIEYIVITVQNVTENVILEKKLRNLNLRDSLTGIYNRRHLDERLYEEFSRHQRYDRTMSIIMIDVDNFKNVNDTHGHQFGDHVLQEIANIAKKVTRGVDVLSRYGGEEFCCILPETDRIGAISVAERLRIEVEKQNMGSDENPVHVTVSQGIAETKKGIRAAEELLKVADDALYEAKNAGRNRVIAINKETYITNHAE